MSDKIKTACIVLAAAVFFILDRAGKWLFINAWPKRSFPLINDWLRLELSANRGMAFGLPLDLRLIIILTAAALVLLVYLAWLNHRKKDFFVLAALALVIAGAYSNLLDRASLNGVIDYFDLRYFGVFNLADMMITFGLAAIVFSYWRRGR